MVAHDGFLCVAVFFIQAILLHSCFSETSQFTLVDNEAQWSLSVPDDKGACDALDTVHQS